MGFPSGSDGNESVCIEGELDSIPGTRRSAGKRNSYPLQYSCLENSMDRGAWWLQSMGLQTVRHYWAADKCNSSYGWVSVVYYCEKSHPKTQRLSKVSCIAVFGLIEFDQFPMRSFMPLWSAGRSVGGYFGLGWPLSCSGGWQLSASVPQFSMWLPIFQQPVSTLLTWQCRVPSTARERPQYASIFQMSVCFTCC